MGADVATLSVITSRRMRVLNLGKNMVERSLKANIDQLEASKVRQDSGTYASLLRLCGTTKALSHGKHVHNLISRHGLERSAFLGSLLVQMYINCGSLGNARAWFDKMHVRNLFSWNFMIGAYTRHAQAREAFRLFERMQLEGTIPDKVTFIYIFSACARNLIWAKAKGKQAHVMSTGVALDVILGNALINMHGKCGSLEDARETFENMLEQDVISWTSMIAAYVNHEESKDALQLFNQMQLQGILPNRVTFISILDACAHLANVVNGNHLHVHIMGSRFAPDVVVQTELVNMYGKCGSIDNASDVFDNMPEHDVVSWNTIIAAYAQCRMGKKASELFNQMQWAGVTPDRATFVSILDGCADQAVVLAGKRMHNIIMLSGLESDVIVGTTLVNMYGKCGSLKNANNVFDRMPQRNVVSWTAIIGIYARHGHSKEALQLFYRMQQEGTKPNEVTFVGVLSACNHAGLVDEGRTHFISMTQEYGILPIAEHYDCMIDLLGRIGRLDEAQCLIKAMLPQATMLSWMALLAACVNHVDVERGEYAAKHLFEIDSENSTCYVTLSNLYAVAGRLDEAAEIRMRRRAGTEEKPI